MKRSMLRFPEIATMPMLGREIFLQKYASPGEQNYADRAKVIAKFAASCESDDNREKVENLFFKQLSTGDFIPGGRIIFGAGRNGGQYNLLNCFSAETRIMTDKGLKFITDIEIGDKVLTHKGRFRPVVNKFSQGNRAKLLEIVVRSLAGDFKLKVTHDHKIMTPKGYKKAQDLIVGEEVTTGFYAEVFKPATIKVTNYVSKNYTVKNKIIGKVCKMAGVYNSSSGKEISDWFGKTVNNEILVNEKFGLWIGYYLSEGCAPSHGNGIKFTFHRDEKDYITEIVNLGQEIFGVEGVIKQSNAGRWTDVVFNSKILNEFHKNYLGSFFNKKLLPWELVGATNSIKEAILTGLIRGDGSFRKGRHSGTLSLTLANPSLVYQAYLMAKSLGYFVHYKYNSRVKKATHSHQGTLMIYGNKPNLSLFNKISGINNTVDDYRILSIKEVQYGREVWDISVDEDHSLVADGIVASNCYRLHPDDNVMSISKTIADMYRISCAGGGVGFNFSNVRPKGDDIQNIRYSSPGSVSVMKMINEIAEHVRAGASRRAALIGIMNVTHPDLLEFLEIKLNKKELNNFNISVGITNEFLDKIETNSEWAFTFNARKYYLYEVNRTSQDGTVTTLRLTATGVGDAIERAKAHYLSSPSDTFDTPKKIVLLARDLWDLIWQNAFKSGDPGIYNVDLANSFTNVSYFEPDLQSPNPCFAGSNYLLTNKGYFTFDELYKKGKPISVVQDSRVEYHGPEKDNKNPAYWKVNAGKAKFSVNKASKVFLTKRNAETLKIIFKSGHELVVTPDHYISTSKGLVQAQHLSVKDKVLLVNSPIFNAFETDTKSSNYKLGLLYGLYLGDGFYDNSKECITFEFWGKDRQYSELVSTLLSEQYETAPNELKYWSDQNLMRQISHCYMVNNEKQNKTRIVSTFAKRLFKNLGIVNDGDKFNLSEQWFRDNNFFAGLLSGLFFTDGTVNFSIKSRSLSGRIGSVNKSLLNKLQLRLGEFGIKSMVYLRNKKRVTTLPDGKGGSKDYDCQEFYELVISSTSLIKMMRGFDIFGDKREKFETSVSHLPNIGKNESWFCHIAKIVPDKRQDVYCIKEDVRRTVTVNGVSAQRCGEIPLPPYGNCCLGHINLSNMIAYDEAGVAEVDWVRLAVTIRAGVRFLDNILTVNRYPVEECADVGKRSRRIGLGTTGYHYMLLKLGYRYGSQKALEFTERLYETIRNEAYMASIRLSEERGPFPAFDSRRYSQELFFKTLPPRIQVKIKNNGIRNAVMLTAAPVGTGSMLWGISSGIEPIFAPIYIRRWRYANTWKEAVVADPLLVRFVKEGKNTDHFVGAYDVTFEEHIQTQATIQKYVDNAISKTANAPETANVDELSTITLKYIPYLKGFTIYRAGSKGQEPLEALPLTQENIDKYIHNKDPQNTQELAGAMSCKLDGECG